MSAPGSRTERWVTTHWPAIHARGMWHFVLFRGVLLWGGAMLAFMAAAMLVQFGVSHPRFPLLMMVALPLCAIGGLAWGLLTWYFNERVYRALPYRDRGK